MLTFGILAVFFILLSGVIFKKNIKQNQFVVVMIVVSGTFIGSIIVNGILGLLIPYSDIEVRTKLLKQHTSTIYTLSDTMEFSSYLEYDYEMEDDSLINNNHVDLDIWEEFHSNDQDILTVKFLPEGDSIPYVSIRRNIRQTHSPWISKFGLPKGKKHYIAFIPNDSIHNVLMEQLNDKFFTDEKELAQSN